MQPYKHIVQYYETDKMGITHHSNYVRWMEEARIHFLREIGWDFVKLEEMGIISPVIEVQCKYKNTTTFEEEIFIDVSVQEYKGVKLYIAYTMRNAEGAVVCEGVSGHAFLDREGRPIRMKKQYPDFHATLESLLLPEAGVE